mmetsp:Transcript_9808/g.36940  ORF Transcript_9808/g.36940 Transcript_9808/m.36940 type:complete len:221 (+) Transcript_9808:183-845(+)
MEGGTKLERRKPTKAGRHYAAIKIDDAATALAQPSFPHVRGTAACAPFPCGATRFLKRLSCVSLVLLETRWIQVWMWDVWVENDSSPWQRNRGRVLCVSTCRSAPVQAAAISLPRDALGPDASTRLLGSGLRSPQKTICATRPKKNTTRAVPASAETSLSTMIVEMGKEPQGRRMHKRVLRVGPTEARQPKSRLSFERNTGRPSQGARSRRTEGGRLPCY